MSLEGGDSGLELPMLNSSLATQQEPLAASVSRKQADLVIAQQASLLQTAESAALPPQELQQEVAVLLLYRASA